MILSDGSIRRMINEKRLVIDPFPADTAFQPASIDLTLGEEFMSPYDDRLITTSAYLLTPGECMLATTREYVEVPADMVARVEGKSSWGRKFLTAHVTAGFIDPGFRGTITLELVNLSRVNQLLHSGSPIAQISFELTDVEVERPYGSKGLDNHYQDQMGVTPTAAPWT